MSSRFTIEASGEAAGQLRKFVTNTQGLQLLSEEPSPQEPLSLIEPVLSNQEQKKLVWEKQTSGLRNYVEILRKPPERLLERYNLGAKQLVIDAYNHSRYNQAKSDFDVDLARRYIGEIFLNSLPEEIPDNYRLRDRKGFKHFVHKRDGKLLPHQIRILLMKYGWVTGVPADWVEIAKSEDSNILRVKNRLHDALRTLSGEEFPLREFAIPRVVRF